MAKYDHRMLTHDTKKERDELFLLWSRPGFTVQDVADGMGWSIRTTYARLKFHGLNQGCPPCYCKSCGHGIEK